MSSELHLRRKWTFKAHGRRLVVVKKPVERAEHVFMKAFLWALFLPDYPKIAVEVPIGDRYKPDLVALDAEGRPVFWAESGKVGAEKLTSLLRRYRDTHFAMTKWATSLHPYEESVRRALADAPRSAPFDLIAFPADSAERFIAGDGSVHVARHQLDWRRLAGPTP